MWVSSCRTMPLVDGLFSGSPASPALSFRRYSIITSLHGSRGDVKSRLPVVQSVGAPPIWGAGGSGLESRVHESSARRASQDLMFSGRVITDVGKESGEGERQRARVMYISSNFNPRACDKVRSYVPVRQTETAKPSDRFAREGVKVLELKLELPSHCRSYGWASLISTLLSTTPPPLANALGRISGKVYSPPPPGVTPALTKPLRRGPGPFRSARSVTVLPMLCRALDYGLPTPASRLQPGALEYSPPIKVNGVALGSLHVGIVPNDAATRRVFSGISRLPRSCIPAVLHTKLAPPSSAHKNSILGADNFSTQLHYAEVDEPATAADRACPVELRNPLASNPCP
ncbi:hypothetical protein PR048_002348 [Dryococelus australis]|uniref:Uncharacterized protein n=1 Tax=Dryococelus australis TaxID=614101 RepID=A0ABQ9IJY5_9NEOP|nr:hypothetical protein PR048_002348 [Dryococelus australis]